MSPGDQLLKYFQLAKSDTTEPPEASGIVMKEGVLDVMMERVSMKNVSVFTQKKTHFWKQAGNG